MLTKKEFKNVLKSFEGLKFRETNHWEIKKGNAELIYLTYNIQPSKYAHILIVAMHLQQKTEYEIFCKTKFKEKDIIVNELKKVIENNLKNKQIPYQYGINKEFVKKIIKTGNKHIDSKYGIKRIKKQNSFNSTKKPN